MPTDDPSDRPSGLLDQLSRLIETLAELDDDNGEQHGHSTIDRGRTRIDYDYAVSIGLGSDARSPSTPAGNADDAGDAETAHIETRASDDSDDLVVVADLPGVTDETAVDAAVEDTGALTISVGDDVVERLTLGDPGMTITSLTVTNQILELRVTPSEPSATDT
nr:gas vesicle protein gvpH [imported] - Halobacterium salinarum [Halobacterium salinarum]CAA45989.1 c-gvpH [Halobacterium salinarum]CAA64347.1 gvpH [Halobacterium salinarum]